MPDKEVIWTPAYKTITTKVCSDMEPLAQLISVLFDTLNDQAFDELPVPGKQSALQYVANTYLGGE